MYKHTSRTVHPISGFTDQAGTQPVYGAISPSHSPDKAGRNLPRAHPKGNRQAWGPSDGPGLWASLGRPFSLDSAWKCHLGMHFTAYGHAT